MAQIKNVSPYGALDVPLLGRVVEAGETVDVDDAHAEILLRQAENFVDATPPEAPSEPPAPPANPESEQQS